MIFILWNKENAVVDVVLKIIMHSLTLTPINHCGKRWPIFAHSFVYEVQCHSDHESKSSHQIELSCSNNGRLALESSTCSSASVLLLASDVIMSQVSFCCYSTDHVTSKWSASSALCCWMRHAFGLIWILFWNIFVYYIRMWWAVKSVKFSPGMSSAGPYGPHRYWYPAHPQHQDVGCRHVHVCRQQQYWFK